MNRWRAGLTLTSVRTLVEYRDQLDLMVDAQMTRQPYPEDLPIPVRDREIWRTRSPLIFYDIVEMHLPDRVLRQFGMVQHEPSTCDTSERLHAIDRRGRAGTDWSLFHADHIAMWDDRRGRVVTADPLLGRLDRSDPYMQWYELITRHPIGPPRDIPPIGSQPVAATKEILVQTAVMATQVAVDLFSCTNMEEVHRLAMTLRATGRRTIAALNEEHRLRGDGRRSRSEGAGPSTSAGPSASAGDRPCTSTRVYPCTADQPISSGAPTDLPSIDDYTVITEPTDWSPSQFVQFDTPPDDIRLGAPTLPPSSPRVSYPLHYTRKKKTRPRYQTEVDIPSQVQLEEPLTHAQGSEQPSQPTGPPTQPQVEDRRRNPARTRKVPSCGTQ